MWDHTYPNDPASLREECTLVQSLSPQAKLLARRGDQAADYWCLIWTKKERKRVDDQGQSREGSKERMAGTDPRVMATRLRRNPLHDAGYMGDSRHICLTAIERIIDADRESDRLNLRSWAWSILLLLGGYWTVKHTASIQ